MAIRCEGKRSESGGGTTGCAKKGNAMDPNTRFVTGGIQLQSVQENDNISTICTYVGINSQYNMGRKTKRRPGKNLV